MQREFIETEVFQARWKGLGLDEKELALLQDDLLKNPESGSVIKGTGGIRKIRIALGSKGKRGGARVIYVDFVIDKQIYFLLVYGKNEASDLTETQKKTLKEYVETLRRS